MNYSFGIREINVSIMGRGGRNMDKEGYVAHMLVIGLHEQFLANLGQASHYGRKKLQRFVGYYESQRGRHAVALRWTGRASQPSVFFEEKRVKRNGSFVG